MRQERTVQSSIFDLFAGHARLRPSVQIPRALDLGTLASLVLVRTPLGPALRKLTLVAVAVSLAFAPLPAALVEGAPEEKGRAS